MGTSTVWGDEFSISLKAEFTIDKSFGLGIFTWQKVPRWLIGRHVIQPLGFCPLISSSSPVTDEVFTLWVCGSKAGRDGGDADKHTINAASWIRGYQ